MKTIRVYIVIISLLLLLYPPKTPAKDVFQIGLPEGAIARLGRGSIEDIAFSPTGKQLAVASMIGIWVYDTQTGDVIALFDGHKTAVRSVAYSPDGITIASGGGLGDDKSIRLWDTLTGEHTVLSRNTDDVRALAFSPDGLSLVSGDQEGIVRLWDITTGEHKHALPGFSQQVTSVAFSPDGKTVASSALNNMVLLWNVDDGKIKHEYFGHTDWVQTLDFSPDGTTLASGSSDGTIRLWDTDTGKQKKILTERTERQEKHGTIAFSPNGNIVAFSIYYKSKIEFLNVATGTVEQTIHIPEGGAAEILYSPDKKTLVGSDWGGKLYFWDLESGENILTIKGHTTNVRALAFSTDGTTLASTSRSGIALWDVETRNHKETIKGHQQSMSSSITSLAFSPNNRTVASADWKGIINLWDYATAEHIITLKGHTDGIRSIVFSSDGSKLATAGNDHTIRIWNPENGEEIHTLLEERGRAFSVAFSPDNLTLASGGFNGMVRLWNVETGDQKLTIPKTGNGWSIAYSPNGVLLATSGSQIKLWHTISGECIQTLDLPFNMEERFRAGDPEGFDLDFFGSMVKSLAYSPDGKTIAGIGRNGLIHLWDIETGKKKHTFSGHKWTVNTLAFSPDGKTLASGSDDDTILLWDATKTEMGN